MLDVHKIIGTIFLALVIYFFWSINSRTRKAIDHWAEENAFTIISKKYVPWHCTWISGGFHPANFKVIVTNLQGELEGYWIRAGGIFLLSDKLNINRTKIKKHNKRFHRGPLVPRGL